MNLAGVIERKGKIERMQDTISGAISEVFDKHLKAMEGKPNNANTVAEIQHRLQHIIRDFPFPVESVTVDAPGIFGVETIRSEVVLR